MSTTAAVRPVTEVLNKQVANWSVLYMKLHHFHWFVQGGNFFTLHVKYEELYTEAALTLDMLAERILALGGKPVSSLKEQLSTASVKEAKGGEKADAMVKETIADFEMIIEELENGVEISEKQGDSSTADMLTGIRTSLEKHVWMLKAYLG